MESDLGKLFIGGISWDTNEDHLREYFNIFGEIVEAVIMKDRTTGRARGFGFVVFADPAVAERVVMEKHLINGRMVEAKKAIPRDDKHILLNKNSNSLQASPGLGRTKKIFVGGLASTVTNTDFKVYFEQFGDITDVVVMYDHNTQRPRGFGFITFDSEDAVDKVLLKTFHELNGKLVEVKRAVPKELSPGPTRRLPTGGHNYGFNRVNSFLNGCSQGYNPGSIVSHGMSMDSRFGPLTGGQKGFSSLGPGHGIGLNFEHGLSHNYGESLNLNDSIGHGQAISSYYSGNSSRLGSLIGYGTGSGISGTSVSSAGHTLWDNGGLTYNSNPASANPFTASGIGSIARFGNGNSNWRGSSSPLSLGNDSGFTTGNLSYGIGDNTFDLFSNNYGRNNHNGSLKSTFTATRNGYEGNYASSCGSNSIYGDPTWQLASNKLDGSSPLGYGFGATSADIVAKGSIDYISGFNATDRHINRDG